MAPIAPVTSVPAISLPQRINATESAQSGAFQALLSQSIGTVEQTRTGAEQSVERFLSGEGEELHHVAMQTQKAELSFELFMQVRNKVVQAYQDIMRMQI